MIDLRKGRWEDALADVGEVDSLITDTPYSERTHSGHDEGTESANSVTKRLQSGGIAKKRIASGYTPSLFAEGA